MAEIASDDVGAPQCLTKIVLVNVVAETAELPHREAARVVEVIFDSMVRALARVKVPEKKIPYFTPSKSLEQKLAPKP